MKVPQTVCHFPASHHLNCLEFKAEDDSGTSWTFQPHLPLSLFVYHFFHLNREINILWVPGALLLRLVCCCLSRARESVFTTLAAYYEFLGGFKIVLMQGPSSCQLNRISWMGQGLALVLIFLLLLAFGRVFLCGIFCLFVWFLNGLGYSNMQAGLMNTGTE